MSEELNDFLEFADFNEKRDWLTKEEKELIERERIGMINMDKYYELLQQSNVVNITHKFFDEVLWQPDNLFVQRLKEWGLNK